MQNVIESPDFFWFREKGGWLGIKVGNIDAIEIDEKKEEIVISAFGSDKDQTYAFADCPANFLQWLASQGVLALEEAKDGKG